MANEATTAVQPVDEVLPSGQLFILGLQHVLVMYAGAVAVPLILGSALKLPKEQVALLINADLFACGIATLVQSIGIWKFGIRMPVMMGVTFASVGPMIALGTNPDLGLLGIYGSVIGAGIVGILIAPLVSRLLPLFPAVVTGTIITVIGISLMRVGINWAAGGPPNVPNYGDPFNLGVAFLVLVVILLITKYVKGFFGNIAVLLGIVIGFSDRAGVWQGKLRRSRGSEVGRPDLSVPVRPAQVRRARNPDHDARDDRGDDRVHRDVPGARRAYRQEGHAAGSRAGLADRWSGLADRRHLQHVPLHFVLAECRSGRRNRRAQPLGDGGGWRHSVGVRIFPKMGHVVASVPQFVLGGAGIVMFGMVAATGIKILAGVDFVRYKASPYIIAISIGFGMIPLVSDQFFHSLPKALQPLLHSGILLASIAAVLLNLYFNGLSSRGEAARAAAAGAHHAEAG